MYGITGDNKQQITCFCTVDAAGETLPPMHVFVGEQSFISIPCKTVYLVPILVDLLMGWISTEFCSIIWMVS